MYKINIIGLYLAEVTETKQEGAISKLTFGKPERAGELMELGVNPKIAEGGLRGNGALVHATNRTTQHDVALNLTVLPTKWRRWIEGRSVSNGVEKGTVTDEPKPFAVGWIVEKTEGEKEMIWYPYCKGKPIQHDYKQSEENIVYSTDKANVIAMQHLSLDRIYTFIDSMDTDIDGTKLEKFFKQVQITDEITAPA